MNIIRERIIHDIFHQPLIPSNKICISILKFVTRTNIVYSHRLTYLFLTNRTELDSVVQNKYSQLPVFGVKSSTYQSTVHCIEILCITFYVMKPRLLFHYYFAFLFFVVETMKTSSIIEKSLNKSFQTLYTFFGAPNMFLLSCIQWRDATLALRFVSYQS